MEQSAPPSQEPRKETGKTIDDLSAEAKRTQAKTLEKRKAGGDFLRAVFPVPMAIADKRMAEQRKGEAISREKHGRTQRVKREKKWLGKLTRESRPGANGFPISSQESARIPPTKRSRGTEPLWKPTENSMRRKKATLGGKKEHAIKEHADN